jgi:hypothetical protein
MDLVAEYIAVEKISNEDRRTAFFATNLDDLLENVPRAEGGLCCSQIDTRRAFSFGAALG